jgi:ERCC4-type nuclease
MAGVKPLELGELGYGDIQIEGRGPEGCPVLVGVEYKKLGDLAQCIDNGRLVGHQLPGMLESYDDVWVLVEGIWKQGRFGEVLVPRGSTWKPLRSGTGNFSYIAMEGFLLTLQEKLQVKVRLTGTGGQTVQWLSALNRWWTGKDWDDHRAHLNFDNSQALSLIARPSLVRKMAATLPGIGWDKSGKVARHFASVVEMVNAPQNEWEQIEGIGKGIAKNVVKAMEGEG